MAEINKSDFRNYLNAWDKASHALKEERRARIADPAYYQDNIGILDEMLQFSVSNSKPRLTSGLVEMQRIFSRARNKS